jgi:outer membrane protein OmpA-like peptidoglycan-associated protein
MSLSARRTKAVVDLLSKKHGVPASRMQSAGVGYLGRFGGSVLGTNL